MSSFVTTKAPRAERIHPRWTVSVALLGVLIASGCGATVDSTATVSPSGGTDAAPDSSGADLRAAVQAYSDAFLQGDGPGSYSILSERCQARNDPQDWNVMVSAAGIAYGEALDFTSFDATVSGDFARVTYTYELAEINQDSEPWVFENGTWREDDC